MKKTTKIILIVFGTLVVLGIASGLFAWNYYKKGIAPMSDQGEEVMVTVESGQTATSVLYTLEDAGLLRNAFCGKIYLKLHGVGNLQANSYLLNKNMSLEQIFSVMEKPTDEYIVKLQVTIIEGQALSDIAKTIATALNMEAEDVLERLNSRSYLDTLIRDYWFITEDILQTGIKYPLEGYLYPETYAFGINATLEDVIRASLDMMDKQLTPKKEAIERTGWSVHEFLTFASIVEREALFDADRPKIAGVLMNRLDVKMKLQVDCTVNYAWERTGVDVTYAHLEIDSPYNTYKYAGLPIGPISTASAVTVDASLNYEQNDFLYFFAKKDGTVIYSKTLSEHSKAVQQNKWY